MNARPTRKAVFNDKDEFVGVADEIYKEIHDVLQPVFNKWCKEEGYSPREVFVIATMTASEQMSYNMVAP